MKSFFAALALSAIAAQGAATAAPVIDQNNPTVQSGFCYIGGNLCGQSFHQSAGTLAGAGFYVDPFYHEAAGDVTIGVYDAASGGKLIASGTVGAVDSNSGWVDAYWTPVAVDASKQYYMLLSSTNSYLVAAFSQTSYDAGTAVFQGSVWSGFDLSFRTYADDGQSNVPEPASLSLLGLGLAGAAAARRQAAKRGK